VLAWAGRPGAAIDARDAAGPGIVRRCPDIGRLRRATGFSPAHSLADGLDRTLAWYRDAFDREAVLW
jgi:UDP-glucuronate decarboxylase